ncbi:MAG: hypothetical protein H6940_03160 [Burkholderiales bacterium]|nr:hypothetical protein [Burkholderiales bacterium]
MRDAAISSSPDVWLLAVQLLERLKQQGGLPKQERELMPLLRSIFCRTPEDQARFPYVFEQCLNDKKPVSIAAVNRLVSTEQDIFNALRDSVRRLDKYWWLTGILVVIAVFLVIVWYPAEPAIQDKNDYKPPVVTDDEERNCKTGA